MNDNKHIKNEKIDKNKQEKDMPKKPRRSKLMSKKLIISFQSQDSDKLNAGKDNRDENKLRKREKNLTGIDYSRFSDNIKLKVNYRNLNVTIIFILN